jgi:hypothetical protein
MEKIGLRSADQRERDQCAMVYINRIPVLIKALLGNVTLNVCGHHNNWCLSNQMHLGETLNRTVIMLSYFILLCSVCSEEDLCKGEHGSPIHPGRALWRAL